MQKQNPHFRACPKFNRVLKPMIQNKLLPCRGRGALVHPPQVVVSPWTVDDDHCPCCWWSENLEGLTCPDDGNFQHNLFRFQRDLRKHWEILKQHPNGMGVAYDPEFLPIERKDFLMSRCRNQPRMAFGSDPETWFYWRSNFWHRTPQIVHKKSYLRKLRGIVQDPKRRHQEQPEVPPCPCCKAKLEWHLRRSHELAYKCPVCKTLYTRGSWLFEGPGLGMDACTRSGVSQV